MSFLAERLTKEDQPGFYPLPEDESSSVRLLQLKVKNLEDEDSGEFSSEGFSGEKEPASLASVELFDAGAAGRR